MQSPSHYTSNMVGRLLQRLEGRCAAVALATLALALSSGAEAKERTLERRIAGRVGRLLTEPGYQHTIRKEYVASPASVREQIGEAALSGLFPKLAPTEALKRYNRERHENGLPYYALYQRGRDNSRATRVKVRRSGKEVVFRLRTESGEDHDVQPFMSKGAASNHRYLNVQTMVEQLGLPDGYHTVTMHERGSEGAEPLGEMRVLVAPDKSYQLEPNRNYRGIEEQVYELNVAPEKREQRNLGQGNLGDLYRSVIAARRAGLDFVGINPLGPVASVENTSPFWPADRRGLIDHKYLDPFWAGKLLGYSGEVLYETGESAQQLARARAAEVVDPKAVSELVTHASQKLHAWFEKNGAATDIWNFEQFITQSGKPLAQFVEWSASQGRPERVVRFEQWLLARQLAEVHRAAKDRGADTSPAMALGLYGDMPVGASDGASEVAANPQSHLPGIESGCPPDPYSPTKPQGWGGGVANPLHMARERFSSFIDRFAGQMKTFGVMRVDHAFLLERLFGIPHGAPDGAYVRYDREMLMAILALESHRNKTHLILEGLGTAPDGFGNAAERGGFSQYLPMSFMTTESGAHTPAFVDAANYPRDGLAVRSSHDGPTLAAEYTGADVPLNHRLGRVENLAAEQALVPHRQYQLLSALKRAGTLPSGIDPEQEQTRPRQWTAALAKAARQFIGRTPSRLKSVRLWEHSVDRSGDYQLEPENVPGKGEGDPDVPGIWRQRLQETTQRALESQFTEFNQDLGGKGS